MGEGWFEGGDLYHGCYCEGTNVLNVMRYPANSIAMFMYSIIDFWLPVLSRTVSEWKII